MLRQFLPSVVRFSEVDGAVVWVADNGSTDDSVETVACEFPSVRLIRLAENYGFAEGYNRALEQVEAEYVVLLNSDVEVTAHWLRPLAEFMDTHPEMAACQPKLLSYHHRHLFEYAGASGGFIDRYGYPFCRGRLMGEVEEDRGQYDTVAPVFWASGAALFIRRSDYQESGGLDARFFAHMEEIDLCWRAMLAGWEIWVDPASAVYHVGGGTLPNNSPRKLYLNFRNNLLMMYKNLPSRSRSRIIFVRMCVDGAIACVYLLTGRLSFFRSVLRAHRDYRRMRRKVTVSAPGADVPRARVSIVRLALVGFRYPSGKVGD